MRSRNLQVAIGEIVRFWNVNDPHAEPPSPGDCAGKGPDPTSTTFPPVPQKPDTAFIIGLPLVQQPSGPGQRGFHVWSLCSFHFLKAMELANFRPPQPGKNPLPPHPAALAVGAPHRRLHFLRTPVR